MQSLSSYQWYFSENNGTPLQCSCLENPMDRGAWWAAVHGSFTPLLLLKKFPDIPVSTLEEARESRPHPEEPRFRLLAREERSLLCVFGKEFPAFPSHLKRRRSHRKGERNSRVVPPFIESSRCLSPSRETCFLCTVSTFKPRVDSHHGGTWDIPVGKPHGKASSESLEGKPLIPCSTGREA